MIRMDNFHLESFNDKKFDMQLRNSAEFLTWKNDNYLTAPFHHIRLNKLQFTLNM